MAFRQAGHRIIAGGKNHYEAVEFAEDDAGQGWMDLQEHNVLR